MSIVVALEAVRAQIVRAAIATGKNPAAITLVAVSKTKPPDAIREAYAAGQRAFGESYAQELEEKAQALADLADIEWHFVGHLQSNKAKIVARFAHVVHTIDTSALARELGRRTANANRTLRVMIEVNVGGEPQKHGTIPAQIEEIAQAIDAQAALVLRGLMTLPPDDPDAAQKAFETLVGLRAIHGGEARLPELSMGMSGDLELAIAAGATLVRVGTAIFGGRSRSAETP